MRCGFGYHSEDAVIALAMLSLRRTLPTPGLPVTPPTDPSAGSQIRFRCQAFAFVSTATESA